MMSAQPAATSEVISFHRSWRSLIPQFGFAFLLAVLGAYVTVRFPESMLLVPFSFAGENFVFPLPIFLLLVLVALARPLIMLFDSYFEISEHHLRIVRGRLSLRKKRQEFAFEDLLGVQVSQSILDRIFRVGLIRVGSRTLSIEITMGGIANPQWYADEISRRIDASRISQREALKIKQS